MTKQDITKWIKVIAKIVETIADTIEEGGNEESKPNES